MYRSKYFSNPKASVFCVALTALVVFLLGSCAPDESGDLSSGGENNIMFDAYLSGSTQLRASVADVEGLKKTGFGVFAFDTGQDKYSPDVAAGHIPNLMYNRQVTWLASTSKAGSAESGAWTYSPEINWTGSYISFFAYAPYAVTLGGNYGVTALSGENVAGDPKLTFKVPGNVNRQTDLLYADTGNTIDCVEGKVRLNFNHALSRISFKQSKVEFDANTSIPINSLTIQSPDFAISGDLNLRTGEWTNLTKQEGTKYELTVNDFVENGDAIQTAAGNYLMIIPTGKTKVEITVSYNVITRDDNLPEGQTSFINKVSKLLEFDFRAGKSYEIGLNITPTSLDLDAVVADWEDSDNHELDSSKDSNSK